MTPWTSDNGKQAFAWWKMMTDDTKTSSSKAGSLATLRRINRPVEALLHPDAISLAVKMGKRPEFLIHASSLACLLAHIRTHDKKSLAAQLGGGAEEQRLMKHIRFRKLMLAESGQERMTAWRRAIQMAKGKANVGELSTAWLLWDHPELGDSIKATWMYQYVGADAS